jgi:NTE family protein
MLLSIFYTMMEAHDNRYIREHDEVRTIQVPTIGVKITDFSLSKEKKQQLFQSGVQAADAFFNTWTFEKYLTARGKTRGITYKLRPSDQKEG